MSSQAIEALYATGHWLHTSGRHAEASEVFRVMTMTRPDDERGWLALGACHEAVGQKSLAIQLYEIASVAAAPAVRCAIARGRALRDLERTDAAVEAFEAAIDLASAADDPELAAVASAELRAS